jgi:hypothetical protein
MASDTRVSRIHDKIEDKYYFADCGRKTFFLKQHNIGISFFGVGYFPILTCNHSELYPIANFLTNFIDNLSDTDSFCSKSLKIIDNIRKISQWDECDKDIHLSGFISGFDNDKACFVGFNTCHKEVTILTNVEEGCYFEKHDCGIQPASDSPDRLTAIQKIKDIMTNQHALKPNEIGGPVDIIEIFPGQNYNQNLVQIYISENECVVTATSTDLLEILKSDRKKNNKYNLTEYQP